MYSCHNQTQVLIQHLTALKMSSKCVPSTSKFPRDRMLLYEQSIALSSRIKVASKSASLLLPKQLASNSKQTLFKSFHKSPASVVSLSTKPGVSRPVFCCWRYDHAMASQSKTEKSVHDFTVEDARGNDVDLSIYKGKVLLVVNLASQCGLTNSNYTELTELYKKYKDQGLEILAFPSYHFGSQEPGTNEQILEFACTRFKAEYPIFDKVDVNGSNAAPIYKFLKSSKGGLLGDSIKWNFAKFLVDKDGNVVDSYAPTTSPLCIERDVKKLLGIA